VYLHNNIPGLDMIDENHHELLAQVASMYYDQQLTQSAIGEELGLSRVKVYRLLKEAREEQIVQITIHWPIKRDIHLEKALLQAFDLNEALVLTTNPDTRATTLRRLGQLGARYLEKVLKDGMTMAICVGRSTYEIIHAIRPGFKAGIHVAQAMGSIPFAVEEFDSVALARELAEKLGGQVLYLSSPLMADSPEAAEVLRSQRSIERTLSAARDADVALLGIGNLDPTISGFVKAGSITPDELITLAKDGAIGDIGGQVFTAAGELHPCDLNQRIIGLTLAELRRIPLTIATAAGLDKASAIQGALRTGVIDMLCIDDQAAQEVLRLEHVHSIPTTNPI
jgi:DNA-binding transcriptional regulator LsrR (DeoR family)